MGLGLGLGLASREVYWVLGLLPPRQLRLLMQLLLDELTERAWLGIGLGLGLGLGRLVCTGVAA